MAVAQWRARLGRRGAEHPGGPRFRRSVRRRRRARARRGNVEPVSPRRRPVAGRRCADRRHAGAGVDCDVGPGARLPRRQIRPLSQRRLGPVLGEHRECAAERARGFADRALRTAGRGLRGCRRRRVVEPRRCPELAATLRRICRRRDRSGRSRPVQPGPSVGSGKRGVAPERSSRGALAPCRQTDPRRARHCASGHDLGRSRADRDRPRRLPERRRRRKLGATERGSPRSLGRRRADARPAQSLDGLCRLRAGAVRGLATASAADWKRIWKSRMGYRYRRRRAPPRARTGRDRGGPTSGPRAGPTRPERGALGTPVGRVTMNQAMRLQFLPLWSWRAWLGLAIAIAVVLVIGVAIFPWPTTGPPKAGGIEEVRLRSGADIPVAIATARDGTVWFTLESSDSLGRLRNGQVERIPRGAASIEPLGLAVGGDGSAWYTDAPKQRIARASPDGGIAFFGLATPIARLGRLAVAPDDAVWFAESTVASVTRLHDGRFTRHVVATLAPRIPADAWPFGIAIAPDGAVWATLPSVNQLLRIAPDGKGTAFDVPTRQSGLGDIAVAPDGTVYFLEMSANKIDRLTGERFEEFTVPMAGAGLTALAVAPDSAAWFTELRSHRLARLHGGRITEFDLPRPDARPFGITVDAENNVWYADLSGWLGRLDASHARVR